MTVPLWLGAFKSGDGGTGGRDRARVEMVRPPAGAHVDPDAVLVTRLRGDDGADAHRALEAVFRAYFPVLCDFAERYVGARDVAREVVSDVFVRLWDRRHAWELQVTLRAYLYGAVANTACNRRRDAERERRRANRSVAGGDDPVWMGIRGVRPDAAAVATDTSDRLWSVVEALGDDGAILLLRWRHGLDYDEIGRALGVSAGAAQRRHSRAMGRLRHALPDLFRDEVG